LVTTKKATKATAITFFFGFVATKKATTIATIAFFLSSFWLCYSEKGNNTIIVFIAFFFGSIATKKATTFVIVAFFFCYVVAKKVTIGCRRLLSFWLCYNKEGDNICYHRLLLCA
jgi:hypothetical protein